MAFSLEDVQQHLARGELEAIEDDWLSRMAGDPEAVDDFAAVARTLADSGAEDNARLLLEMLDGELCESERWEARLALLRACGELVVPPEDLHPAILDTVRRIYHDRPSREAMIEKVGLLRAVDDLPKTWQKVDRLAVLLAFDVGAVVYMKNKGPGRVIEANMALDSFKVELERIGELHVGFRAAAKLLKPLPPSHVLRRKYDDPAALEKLRDEQPAELLRLVLESYDEPRTGAEIRRDLAGIVSDEQWNGWWAAARQHPQVVASGKGRRAYRWTASSAAAQDAVWQAFLRAEPRRRLLQLRREGSRDPALRQRMAENLAGEAARAAAENDPGLACEIWLALERLDLAPQDVPWAAPALIAGAGDLRALARGIEDRALRERAYHLVRETRPFWQDDFALLFSQESDPRSLDRLAAELATVEGALERQLELLLSQPRKAPAAFVWLAERAADNADWRRRNPLRLLTQILWALADDDTFGTFRTRLAKTVESGGTVPRLLDDLDPEQAEQALAAIRKATGLLHYQREPLKNALELRFPALRQDDAKPLYATQEAIAAKRAELKELLEEEIPQNRRAIEAARELGDLRENFEYKSARQRHEYLAARAARLDEDLKRARPIDPTQVRGDEVVIGSRVLLRRDGDERTITILGPWESAPENDVLSNESELAQELLGQPKGSHVEIAGTTWQIAAIEPWN